MVVPMRLLFFVVGDGMGKRKLAFAVFFFPLFVVS
jgi:hypothetical protein